MRDIEISFLPQERQDKDAIVAKCARLCGVPKEKIAHIEPKKYASDKYKAYDLIDPKKRLIGKAYTYSVERMNRLLRHYLARFTRKTYCYSKSISMIADSVLLFL